MRTAQTLEGTQKYETKKAKNKNLKGKATKK